MRLVSLFLLLFLSACSTVPADIQSVNQKWNAVPYVAEKKQNLTGCDYFKAHGGDCEEFAICKQKDLFAAYYLDARVVLGHTGNGTPHAITYAGGYYLDNRTDRISKTPIDFKPL